MWQSVKLISILLLWNLKVILESFWKPHYLLKIYWSKTRSYFARKNVAFKFKYQMEKCLWRGSNASGRESIKVSHIIRMDTKADHLKLTFCITCFRRGIWFVVIASKRFVSDLKKRKIVVNNWVVLNRRFIDDNDVRRWI